MSLEYAVKIPHHEFEEIEISINERDEDLSITLGVRDRADYASSSRITLTHGELRTINQAAASFGSAQRIMNRSTETV